MAGAEERLGVALQFFFLAWPSGPCGGKGEGFLGLATACLLAAGWRRIRLEFMFYK